MSFLSVFLSFVLPKYFKGHVSISAGLVLVARLLVVGASRASNALVTRVRRLTGVLYAALTCGYQTCCEKGTVYAPINHGGVILRVSPQVEAISFRFRTTSSFPNPTAATPFAQLCDHDHGPHRRTEWMHDCLSSVLPYLASVPICEGPTSCRPEQRPRVAMNGNSVA
jgi:hypothetical protein